MKFTLIAGAGLIGWAGIVRLAYVLADNRMAACQYSTGYTCELRVTAARDNILIGGLTVGLIAVLAWAVAMVVLDQRAKRSDPPATPEANREHPRLLTSAQPGGHRP